MTLVSLVLVVVLLLIVQSYLPKGPEPTFRAFVVVVDQSGKVPDDSITVLIGVLPKQSLSVAFEYDQWNGWYSHENWNSTILHHLVFSVSIGSQTYLGTSDDWVLFDAFGYAWHGVIIIHR